MRLSECESEKDIRELCKYTNLYEVNPNFWNISPCSYRPEDLEFIYHFRNGKPRWTWKKASDDELYDHRERSTDLSTSEKEARIASVIARKESLQKDIDEKKSQIAEDVRKLNEVEAMLAELSVMCNRCKCKFKFQDISFKDVCGQGDSCPYEKKEN